MIDKLIPYLKLGIKIKEKNKGSFTRYCNGKVTQECIDKGKKSPNKAIRKKAVFAENSRKWKHQQGGSVKESWLPGWFKDVKNIERIMRTSNAGDISNLLGIFNEHRKDINYGSRIVGRYSIHNPKTGAGFVAPQPDKSRDLISQYLYKKSSLVPYKNATPITVDGKEWTGDQFEGKIFLQPNMTLPKHMQEMVEDYINNKRLLSVADNVPSSDSWYEEDNIDKTYDNVRRHYISFKKDKQGNIYADIFDRWDMDHNILGKILEKYYGNPFILRQKVPVVFSEKYDDNTMDYLQNLKNDDYGFKGNLNKNYDLTNLKVNQDRWGEHYREDNFKYGGKIGIKDIIGVC